MVRTDNRRKGFAVGFLRRRNSITDTYGVEVRDPLDVVLGLAVTVAVDALPHETG